MPDNQSNEQSPNIRAGDIFTVDDLLSPDECTQLIEHAHQLGFEESEINGQKSSFKKQDFRNNSRVFLEDSSWLDVLWIRLSPLLPRQHFHWNLSGLNERMRLYRMKRASILIGTATVPSSESVLEFEKRAF